jgi:hypothetical protein
MDLDIHERCEAIQHYAKVLVLSSKTVLWRNLRPDWVDEVKQELVSRNLDWLDEDSGQRPSSQDEPGFCDTPAWRSMLESVKHWSTILLSRRRDIDTVLGEVQRLLLLNPASSSLAV